MDDTTKLAQYDHFFDFSIDKLSFRSYNRYKRGDVYDMERILR